ncbi:MAG: cellulase family glycosylhydrolase [Oscillospiraceae bacterium]|nr:cellulase family glycosylhydrolase [Oscillospiraceae bacterium]
MKIRHIISFILCAAMLFSLCACGDTQTAESSTQSVEVNTQSISKEADYLRAFEMAYVDEKYKSRDIDEQLSSLEYRSMLIDMMTVFECEDIPWFESKVTEADMPLSRGAAIIMSYYAAVCMGADNYNNSFDHERAEADGKFWDVGAFDPNTLFPDCLENISVEMNGQTWDNEYTAAFLWNVWHSSPYSGEQTVAFDEAAGGMRNTDPFSVEQAVCAIARLSDSFGKEELVAVDSEAARKMDADIWTEELAAKAAASGIEKIEDLPKLTGFSLYGKYSGYSSDSVDKSETDIRNVADWGFSSARMQLRYEVLFSDDCSSVNLTQMEKLDKIVAAAVENDIHLNLCLCTLPGRTIWLNNVDFRSGGEFDLFVNEAQQEKAALVWETLAERYKEVPGEYLSFTPFWEPFNYSISTGAEAPEYGPEEISRTLDKLTAVIRNADPERFMIYEIAPDAPPEIAIEKSLSAYTMMQQKYDNTMISYNFCQRAYVFAELTAAEDENKDKNNHGLFKPDYPVKIYAAKAIIESGEEILIDGCLPRGTSIEMYLSSSYGNGTFTIESDKAVLHSEALQEAEYETNYKISYYYPFAESEKKIALTLEENAEYLRLSCVNGGLDWSGINVILPEEYAQERWYMNSSYDAFLRGEDESQMKAFELKSTSTVMICPNSNEDGTHITIHDDLSYSSDTLWQQANTESIEEWASGIAEFSPLCHARVEDAAFSQGTTQDSMIRYYDDVYSIFEKYSINWYSNDYDIILGDSVHRIADARVEPYGMYVEFNKELLECLQRHQ